jgi:hypothetical protein
MMPILKGRNKQRTSSHWCHVSEIHLASPLVLALLLLLPVPPLFLLLVLL